MLRTVIKKELLSAFRDSRLQMSVGILLILMIVAVLVGKQSQEKIANERRLAGSEMYNKWINQGEKHPHSAAHFGQFAFKPKSVLSFLDIGIDNYTGTSVYLEAHSQNEALYSNAQNSSGMIRFGELTIALILQILVPLLIIFLSFNSFTRERDEGTLKLVQGQGISMMKLFWGKTLAAYIMIMSIFIPVVVLSYILLGIEAFEQGSGITIKFSGFLLSYMVYFMVFTLLCMVISGLSKTSTTSLLTMLSIWAIMCIVLPKATFNMADKLYPNPSHFEFTERIKVKVANGIDGHNPSDQRLELLKKEVLDQYGVSDVKDLPVNWSGIAMQAGEEYTDKVYDEEFSNIERAYLMQNLVSEWSGFINPYMAIRKLSMAFAGTDYYHHSAFLRAAENYRRGFVKKLNKDMELNHKPQMSWGEYNVGKEMWSSIAPFDYQLPTFLDILYLRWISIAALFLWLMLFLGAAFKLPSKISIL